MAVIVRIPSPLRKLTGGASEVEAKAESIGALISALDSTYPGMRERLCDETGAVRRFVNIYVNEEDIRFLTNQSTPLKDGDQVSIVPAIAGGACSGMRRMQGAASTDPERTPFVREERKRSGNAADGHSWTGS
jgi:molybdopterin synthase sulfur carrier subunit